MGASIDIKILNERKAKKYVKTVRQVVKDNGLENDVNVALYDALYSSYLNFLTADHEIDREGLFLSNRFGDTITHPAHKASLDSKTNIAKLLETLGVNAKLRGRLSTKNDEVSDLENFLNEGRSV